MNIKHLGDHSEAPTEGLSPGAMYYNTTDKTSYIFDGSSWNKIATDGLDGSAGILDMRYGDGDEFTYDIEEINGTDGIIIQKKNIGIPEGAYVGYKIVAATPTDEELLVDDVYNSYEWNETSPDFGIKYFIQLNESHFTKIYDGNKFIYNPSTISFSCKSEQNNKEVYLIDNYYYQATFQYLSENNTLSHVYTENNSEYILCDASTINLPIEDVIDQIQLDSVQDIVSCQISLYSWSSLSQSYTLQASTMVYIDYAMTTDMAKLALNAYDITASIGSNKLLFNENGLSIYGDGLRIYNNTESINPIFYADDNGDLFLKGTIEAVGGSLGGWLINEDTIYHASYLTGLHSGNSLGDGADPIRFYSGKNGNNYTFSVSASGNLIANSAQITGEINALGGTIKNYMIVGDNDRGITIFGGTADLPSFIGTSTYSSGALGYGWKIASNGEAEFTNITARGKIASSVFEYNKISSIGGSMYITPTVHLSMMSQQIKKIDGAYQISWDYGSDFKNAGGRVWKEGDEIILEGIVTLNGLQYDITNTFGHIIRLPSDNSSLVTIEVQSFYKILADLSGGTFIAGSLFIFYGTKIEGSTELQKSGIYLTATDSAGPFIDVYDIRGEVATTPAVRMGRLSGITDPNFAGLKGYGLYSTNAYLTGELTLPNAGISNQTVIGYNGNSDNKYYDLDNENQQDAIRIWAGGNYPATDGAAAPFIVTQDGSLYAKKGIFEGTVKATDGYFSGVIKSAGIVLNQTPTSSHEHSHFFVAYKDKPENYDDYILNIDANGLSIWEGALRVYSDEAEDDAYSYSNDLTPLPYLFLQDSYDTAAKKFTGRLVTYNLHNFMLDANESGVNHSIAINDGIWFYNSTNAKATKELSEIDKKNIEVNNYTGLSQKKNGIILNNNFSIIADREILLNNNTTLKNPEAEVEFRIGELTIKEIQDTNNKTIGINII